MSHIWRKTDKQISGVHYESLGLMEVRCAGCEAVGVMLANGRVFRHGGVTIMQVHDAIVMALREIAPDCDAERIRQVMDS